MGQNLQSYAPMPAGLGTRGLRAWMRLRTSDALQGGSRNQPEITVYRDFTTKTQLGQRIGSTIRLMVKHGIEALTVFRQTASHTERRRILWVHQPST
jgi:hypothetical protein